MAQTNFREISDVIRDELRLKTLPVAVNFLKNKGDFPDKTRQPSVVLQKRITICQAVTLARVYGWTVGLTREDLICVPAMIAFGFSRSDDPPWPGCFARSIFTMTRAKLARGLIR